MKDRKRWFNRLEKNRVIPSNNWDTNQQESEGPLPGPEKSDIRFNQHIEYIMILHLTMQSLENRATLEQIMNDYMPLWYDQNNEQINGIDRTAASKQKEDQLLDNLRQILEKDNKIIRDGKEVTVFPDGQKQTVFASGQE